MKTGVRLATLVTVFVLGGCGSAAPTGGTAASGASSSSASTTAYETYAYELVMPAGVGLTPLNDDPAFVWSHPEVSYTGRTSVPAFGLTLQDRPTCDDSSMLAWARELEDAITAPDKTEPVIGSYARGSAASYTFKGGSDLLIGGGFCSGHRGAWYLTQGLHPGQVKSIIEGITFREPPGDPLHPSAS